MTGMDLRLRRTAAKVQGQTLAKAMGVTPQRISAIERSQAPSVEATARYLEALGRLRQDPDGLVTSGHGRAA